MRQLRQLARVLADVLRRVARAGPETQHERDLMSARAAAVAKVRRDAEEHHARALAAAERRRAADEQRVRDELAAAERRRAADARVAVARAELDEIIATAEAKLRDAATALSINDFVNVLKLTYDASTLARRIAKRVDGSAHRFHV